MTDCMVLQSCIVVTQNYNVTLPNTTSPTLIWAGTYLDSVDDATMLSLLPSSVKVSPPSQRMEFPLPSPRTQWLTYHATLIMPHFPDSPHAAQPMQPGSSGGSHLLCLLHVCSLNCTQRSSCSVRPMRPMCPLQDGLCVPCPSAGDRRHHREHRAASED